MGIGKYSPTVTASYIYDRDWFSKVETENFRDPDGYDSYGYSGEIGDGPDRAGYTEDEYVSSYTDLYPITGIDEIVYDLYDGVRSEWANKIITFPSTNVTPTI